MVVHRQATAGEGVGEEMNEVGDHYRTHAHRRFKRELTNLSRLHWVFSYGVEFVRQSAEANGHSKTDRLMAVLPVKGFESERLNISIGDFSDHLNDHVDHLRLLLLVKACANLEDYLHRIAQIWVVGDGYFDAQGSMFLDRRGKALIAPALVSNLESSMNYLALLLGTTFGSHAGLCGKAYKLRCLAAHNGGIVDQEAIKVFPAMKAEWGNPIRLAWSDLHKYLKAISATTNLIERAIPTRKRVQSEVRIIVGELIGAKECSSTDEPFVRRLLKERFSFSHLPGRSYLAGVLKGFE